MGKLMLLLLTLYLCSASSFGQEENSTPPLEKTAETRIELEGSDHLIIPEVGLIRPDSQWSYPLGSYPIIAQGRNISGLVLGAEELSGTKVGLYLSGFSIQDFLSPKIALNKSISSSPQAAVSLNASGCANFSLEGVESGLFSLFALDRENQTVLSALPLLVTAGNLEMEIPEQVTAGDVIYLQARAGPGNDSRIYGAIMLSLQDFSNSSLITSTDGQNVTTAISLGQKSQEILGVPGISRDFLMNLFLLLPANSAVGMVESNQSETTFNLITDREWDKGSYVLTAAVYSQGRIEGIKQGIVEVK